MAALKWLVVGICSLGALGLTGLGVKQSLVLRGDDASAPLVAKVTVRSLPKPFAPGARVEKPTAPGPSEPVAGVVSDTSVPLDAGRAAAPAPPAPAPAPAVIDAGAPAPAVVVKPAAAPAPAPAPVAAVNPSGAASGPEGILFLRSSDTADVFVDGKRVGSAPVLNLKAKVGPHKVRFDCYDAAGNTVAGAVQNIMASVEKPVDITFQCPPSE